MVQGSTDHSNRPLPAPEHFILPILFSYSALVPVKSLSFPLNVSFSAAHEFFLNKMLLNHHLKRYPPSESYQRSFWKWVLAHLENLPRSDEDDEIDERLYAHYLRLISSACESETPLNSFITRYWEPPGRPGRPMEHYHETITLLESRTTIEAGTTGLRTWKASLVLAQYLIQHPHIVSARNVLELGSGTGFIGILVASLQLHAAAPVLGHGMKSVYLTDVNSKVLGRCQHNVRLPCNKSSSHPNVYCKSLDWLDSLSDQENLRSFFYDAKLDVVLGADIVFDPALVPPLVKTIHLSLSSGPTQAAFIALTVRNGGTLSYFLDEIGKVLEAEEITYDSAGKLLLQVPDQVDAELGVKIFKIIRRSNT